MCVTFLCTNGLERGLPYKLILLNNRDEALDRPTSACAWADGFLAGRDEMAEERGTWLGITRSGRIANILSITEPKTGPAKPDAPSRGAIAKEFLTGGKSVQSFGEDLAKRAQAYHGFHFVALERNAQGRFDLYCLANRLVPEVKLHSWPPGVYGFGNSPRSCQMGKVRMGETMLTELLNGVEGNVGERELVSKLRRLLKDDTLVFPDPQVALQTQRPPEYHKNLCSIFVRFPLDLFRYGTREERMVTFPDDLSQAQWEVVTHRFKIEQLFE